MFEVSSQTTFLSAPVTMKMVFNGSYVTYVIRKTLILTKLLLNTNGN